MIKITAEKIDIGSDTNICYDLRRLSIWFDRGTYILVTTGNSNLSEDIQTEWMKGLKKSYNGFLVTEIS